MRDDGLVAIWRGDASGLVVDDTCERIPFFFLTKLASAQFFRDCLASCTE